MPDVKIAKIAEVLYKYELPTYLVLNREEESMREEVTEYQVFCLERYEKLLISSKKLLEAAYGFELPEIDYVAFENHEEVTEKFCKSCIEAFVKKFGKDNFNKKEEAYLTKKLQTLEENFPVVTICSLGKGPYGVFVELIEMLKKKMNGTFTGALADIKRRYANVQQKYLEKKAEIENLLMLIPDDEVMKLWQMNRVEVLIRFLQNLVCEYLAYVEGNDEGSFELYYSLIAV